MNYRHAYHAGNFADVVKHAVLTLVIEYLKQKPAPFRVIDTHAGIGSYDLAGEQAQKTGEWRDGIGRVLTADLPAPAAKILAPYLDIVRALNPGGLLTRYPGSPLIARALLRPADKLILNELHPEDVGALRRLFAHDAQVKVMELDAFTALKALLPPPERRGLVLVDPAFEQPGELTRLVHGLKDAIRRFATGTFLLWYPIKQRRAIEAFHRQIADLGLAKVMAIELTVRAEAVETQLNGAGLIAVNPPFTLEGQLHRLLPELARLLAQGAGGGYRLLPLGPSQAQRSGD